MNTHDKIELPPHDATASVDGMKPVRLYSEAKVRAAIEADRKALDDTVLTCDSCGVICQNPWHTSHGENRHVHLCDACYEAGCKRRGSIVNNASASSEPVERPDEYVYFSDWHCKDAPDESEVPSIHMARHAWLAGIRFADLFPVAAPQPAEPVKVPSENTIAQVKRQRDGWMEENHWLRSKLVERQALLDSLLALQNNDTWHWMGDGEDHLESMGSQMRVVISAADLRALLASYGSKS